MKAKEFWQRFSQDRSPSKNKIIQLLAVTILTFVIFSASVSFINGQGSRMSIAENEITREKAFINQYHAEEAQFKKKHGSSARLTTRSEIEKIQNELIQKTKDYQLDVISVQSIQTADKNGLEFEMAFTGAWEMAVQYIRQLQESDSLISILSCLMNPKPDAGNLVEIKLKYKIYVE